LGTSENHFGPSLDFMLDAQKLPSQALEALLAFCQAACGRALSCRSITPLDSRPRRRFWMAYRNRLRVAQYDSALTFVHRGMNSTRRTPFRSQKTVAMIFRVDSVCLNFLGFEGDREWCHSSDWRLLSGVKWETQVASPVTIWTRNLSSSRW
jgi:hypothetical protein